MRKLCIALLLCCFAAGVSANEKCGPVEVAVVLALDISGSMVLEDLKLQRKGYAEAFQDPEIIKIITEGGCGRVAVTVFEWWEAPKQKLVIPWTVFTDEASVEAFGLLFGSLRLIPRSDRFTAPAGAIRYGTALLDRFMYKGHCGIAKCIIDISGDGSTSESQEYLSLEKVRAEALAQGVIINGLPVVVGSGERDIDAWYEKSVIGGRGSFIVATKGWKNFPEAIKKKLKQELMM